jgi:hypothetical protein
MTMGGASLVVSVRVLVDGVPALAQLSILGRVLDKMREHRARIS